MIQLEEPLKEVQEKQAVECPLGRIEINEEDVLLFPDGLYGYEQYHQYLIWKSVKYLPFQWLICIENPKLMFPVINPNIVCPEYDPKVRDGEGDSMLAIVTMGASMESVTANLRAPILISRDNHQGKQVILTDSHYPLRYKVLHA